LAGFAGREAFDHHVALMDRQFMRAGQAALAENTAPGDVSPDQQAALAADAVAQQQEAARQRAADQPRDNGRFAKAPEQPDGAFVPKFDEDFDERLVSEFQRLNEYYAGRMEQFEARLHQADQRELQIERQNLTKTFDGLVDGLGHDDLFGRANDLQSGTDAFAARSKLWDATTTLVAGMAARGQTSSLDAALLKRALNQEFADNLVTKSRRDFTNKIRKQSARKLGGGAQKVNRERPFTGDLRDDPELHATHKRMTEETGGY
jgi:hypothetical protein